jgi:hypothetical protein
MWFDDEDDRNEGTDDGPLSFGDGVRYAITAGLFVAMPWIAGNTPVWLSLSILAVAISFNAIKEILKRRNHSLDE